MSDSGHDAKCVLLKDCPPITHTTTPKPHQCGPNAGYAVCPRRKDLTCDSRLHPDGVSPPSTTCMQPGCRCTPGHVRLSGDPISGCVPVCECPNYDPFAELECGQHEEFVKCPRFEDATCKEVPEPRRSRRASAFGEDCLKPRCMCKAGFVRENRERDAACVSKHVCLLKR
ncbi:hypothetical protein AAVH_15442 [Aphelenchoides avenae]|nr:hypothetical protein AAVH_15442 [Aphelenchus avenae]